MDATSYAAEEASQRGQLGRNTIATADSSGAAKLHVRPVGQRLTSTPVVDVPLEAIS